MLAFLAPENENRQLEDLPLADFARLPERLVGKDATIVIWDCRFIYFHSLIKSAFLVSKGLLYLCDKQNNTWLVVDMEFSSCVQLDISLIRCANS